jgi:predicted RND superfamily exporter protein
MSYNAAIAPESQPTEFRSRFDRGMTVPLDPLRHLKLNVFLSNFFYEVGRYCSLNARMVIYFFLMFTTLTGIGWMRLDPETRAEKLYTPQHSQAFTDKRFVDENFGNSVRFMKYYYVSRESNLVANNIGKNAIIDMFTILNDVEGVSDMKVRGSDGTTANDACYESIPGKCRTVSPLVHWNYNLTSFLNDPDWIGTLSKFNYTDKLGNVRQTDPTRYLGGAERDGNGRLTYVKVYQNQWALKKDDEAVVGEHENKGSVGLELAFSKYIYKKENFQYPYAKLYSDTGYEFDTAIGISFQQDGILTFMAYMLITLYSVIALSDTRDPRMGRSLLGFATVFVVGCSIASSFGALIGLNVPFSLVVNSVIFVMLGLGMDDAFIILEALDRQVILRNVEGHRIETEDDISHRISRGLSEAAPSITLTSITDFAAFLIGTTTVIPAVRYFCIFASVTILVDYVLQVTLFVAFVHFNEVSKQTGSVCLISVCMQSLLTKIGNMTGRSMPITSSTTTGNEIEMTKTITNTDDAPSVTDIGADQLSSFDKNTDTIERKTNTNNNLENKDNNTKSNFNSNKDKGRDEKSMIRWFISYKLPRFLISKVGKLTVLITTIALLVVGAFGIDRLKLDFQYKWFLPKYDLFGKHNIIYDARQISEEYFDGEALPVGVYLNDGDYYTNRAEIDILVSKMVDSKWIIDSSALSWYHAWNFDTSNSGRLAINEAAFYNSLNAWYNTPLAHAFRNNIKFDSAGKITASSILFLFEDMDDTKNNIQAMRDTRDIAKASAPSLDSMCYTEPFLFWEGLAIVYEETIRNMSVALVVVWLFCSIFLEDIYAGTLCAMNILAIDVCLLGFIHWCGMYMNTVTGINLILALGLTVDYSAHICHAFTQAIADTAEERVCIAFSRVGTSVFNGGMTTFVGIFALSIATTYVFQNFFICFLLIISLGLYFGMVVLPVVLLYVGPSPHYPQNGGGDTTTTTAMVDDDNTGKVVSVKSFCDTEEPENL